jgi:hypothetical protein
MMAQSDQPKTERCRSNAMNFGSLRMRWIAASSMGPSSLCVCDRQTLNEVDGAVPAH